MIVTCKLVEYPRLGTKILKENPIVLREKIKITPNQMADFNASHENMEYIEIVEEVKKTSSKTVDSEAKKQFQLHIEAYAKANPAKYELKKEALLAKLNTL